MYVDARAEVPPRAGFQRLPVPWPLAMAAQIPQLNLAGVGRRASSGSLLSVEARKAQAEQMADAAVEGAGLETARGLLGQDEATSSTGKLLDVVAAPTNTPRHNLAKNQAVNDANLALFARADDGDAAGLKRALEAGGNPNWFNMKEAGQTALHRACLKRNIACIDLLLQKVGVEDQENEGVISTVVDIKDRIHENTPLHIAAAQGNLRLLNQLLDLGAQVNTPNNLGNVPLHTAAVSNHVGCVRELIKRGAVISETNKRGSTALHFAVYGLHSAAAESTQIVSLLLQEGCGVDVADRTGTTALHVAASHGFCKVASTLLEFGADVGLEDQNGRDALYYAESKGFSEMLFLLNSVPREEKQKPKKFHEM